MAGRSRLQAFGASAVTEDVLRELLDWRMKGSSGVDVPRYARAMWLRYCADPVATLDGLAAEFGVTRERVRAIEAWSLRRLRHPERRRRLMEAGCAVGDRLWRAVYGEWGDLVEDAT